MNNAVTVPADKLAELQRDAARLDHLKPLAWMPLPKHPGARGAAAIGEGMREEKP